MASWFRKSGVGAGGGAEPANAAAAAGKPLLLIGFNDATGAWELGAEAVAMLQGVRGPLCTLSVCGRARQGKSFLLNQMLGKLTGVDTANGFVVSPTHQSCTRGIWVWSAPVTVAGPDGRKCHAVSGRGGGGGRAQRAAVQRSLTHVQCCCCCFAVCCTQLLMDCEGVDAADQVRTNATQPLHKQ